MVRLAMDKVRFGLLGCGTISQYAHLAALQKAEGVELTAICDVAEDLLERVARRYEIGHAFSNLERFLNEPETDAVLIATADQDHVRHAIECLRHGKHVLVEKPLGLDLDECRRLAQVVENTGLKLQVGNMKRFDPGIEFARRFIEDEMGDRLSVSGWYCDSAARPAMQDSLRLRPIRSASQRGFDPSFKANRKAYKLITHGSHLVDTLRCFGGEIAAVEAEFASKNGNFTWHGLLRYADGAAGHFELTIAVKMDWWEGFHVHGEHGSIVVRSFLPFFNRPSEVQVFDAARHEYRAPLGADSDAYERQVEAFARCILKDEPAVPNVYDGIASLAVIRAIERSAGSGRWTEVETQTPVRLTPQ
jgi:predicted dehydrogenase